jgi:hypothetical protein
VVEAGWQKCAYREFKYDANDLPTDINLHLQSGLGGSPNSLVPIAPMWPNLENVSSTVIPVVTVDPRYPTTPPTLSSWRSRTDRERIEKEKRLAQNERDRLASQRKADAVVEASVPLLSCPTTGCIRKFTSARGRAQHIAAQNCQINGSTSTRSRRPYAPSTYDEMTVKDLAIIFLQEITQTVMGT